MYLKLFECFSYASDDQPTKKGATDHDRRLGPAGLALHYANIIMQIDTLVSAQNMVLLVLSVF